MNEVWNKLNFSEETISRIFSNIHYPGNNNECWEWVGYHNNRGYGNIGLFGTYHLAHRLVYQCYNGSIGSNICVLHHCDNPKCVNPEHLFLGTRKDNINDMVNKHRQNSQKGSKHCNAKLTENDVVEMMVGTITGKYNKISDIVRSYNVSEVIIRKIFKGLLWKQVTDNFDLKNLKDKLYILV